MPPTGTTDNPTATSTETGAGSSGQSGANAPVLSSGTASAALIAAAEAASSADTETGGNKPVVDADPKASTSTAGAITGATGQPLVPAAQATGEAPASRIEAAVRNAREETRREVEAQFAPFKGMNPEDVQVGLQVLQELRADPEAFFRDLGNRLKTRGGGATEEEEAYPAADIVNKDGTLKTYSEATHQKILDIHARRVEAQLMKKLQPFIKFAETEQSQRAEATAQSQRDQTIAGALVEARKLPHFTKENEPAILAAIQAIPEAQRKELGPVACLHMAYGAFLRDKVFPTIESAAEKKVRESFQRKANAGAGGVHPSDQGGDPKNTPIKGVDGLARHMERLAEVQAGSS